MKKTILLAYTLIGILHFANAQYPILDPTFNGNGYGQIAIPGNSEEANALKIQSDGKIVLAGYRVNSSADHDVMVSRVNSNGTPDLSFTTYTSHIGTNSEFNDMAIQSDGKIVCVGRTGTLTNSDVLVMRFLTNGMPDSTFSGDGMFTVDLNALGLDDQASSIKIQSDGKIVVAGSCELRGNYNLFVIRLTTSGSLDNSFNGNGYYYNHVSRGNDMIYSMDLSGGKIVLCGSGVDSAGNYLFLAARILSNGGMDLSFGTMGVFTNSIPGNLNIARKILALSNGKYLLVCNTSVGSIQYGKPMIMRLLSDGTLDNDYALFGISNHLSIPKYFVSENAALAPNGDIVLEGYHMGAPGSVEIGVGRIDSTGVYVSGFGTNGFIWFSVAGGSNICHDIALQTDGKIVLAGAYRNSTMTEGDLCAIRLSMSGTGISDMQTDVTCRAYPNPLSDELHIESNTPLTAYAIYTLDGKVCIETSLEMEKETVIDVRTLSKGIYVLQVHTIAGNKTIRVIR